MLGHATIPCLTSHPTPFLILCAVGRKQFMRFEWANHAAEVLGCDYEELNTATFKHHLRQIIHQMTSGPQHQGLEDNEGCSGTKSSRLHSGCPAPCCGCTCNRPTCFPMFTKTSPESCSMHVDEGQGTPAVVEKEMGPPCLVLTVKHFTLACNCGGC